MNNFIEIGKILKTKGVTGYLRVVFKYPLISRNIKALFYSKDLTCFNPLIINQIQEDNESYIIKFDKYNSKEQAKELNNTRIFLPKDKVEQYFEMDSIDDWIGYEVQVGETIVGNIINVIDMQYQLTLEVKSPNSDHPILIPLIDEWILDINIDDQVIEMDLPDGLLELNQ